MDIFSHALLPYLIGRSLKRNKEEVTAFVIGGISPDFDILIMWINLVYPTFFLITHRGITHSFFFGFLAGMFVLYLASRAGIRTKIRRFVDFEPALMGRTVAFAFCGVAIHLFLDYMTTRGIPLLYPFSISKFSAELFFYTDLFLTIMSLAMILYLRKRPERVKAVNFLIIFLLVFALAGGLRMMEKDRAMAYFAVQNEEAYPTSNPFDWYIVEEDESYIKIYEFDGYSGNTIHSDIVRRLNVSPDLDPDNAIATAGKLPQVKMFEWRAYTTAINATHIGNEWLLEYRDPVSYAQVRDMPRLFTGLSRGFSSLNVTVNGSTAIVT